MLNYLKYLKNKELFIALYFLFFILGIYLYFNFYNIARVLEVLGLLIFFLYNIINKRISIKKIEIFFLIYLVTGVFFWKNPYFNILELLLFYLLYKIFFSLNYNPLITKIIVITSFLIFLLFPISILEYLNSGTFKNWYPLPWNIRVYNSYFLIFSIFSVWFYLKEEKFKNIYLTFIFLALLSILLDSGRSAALAYSVFIACVCIFNRTARIKILFTYIATWLIYFSILFFSDHISSNVRTIARETTSGRYELWVNAFQCWLQKPFFGCGFYQLDQYPYLSAHPHNLFIQILTETGLIGFSFLVYIIYTILNRISWNLKENYFVIAAFIAIAIDLSFSGTHIYPITQVALLWLFIFLLKNPEFNHAIYFIQPVSKPTTLAILSRFVIYILIALVFIYLFVETSVLSENLPSAPPRFWEYGYKLF